MSEILQRKSDRHESSHVARELSLPASADTLPDLVQGVDEEPPKAYAACRNHRLKSIAA